MTDEDLEDIIADAISDSIVDQDWLARDGAKAVMRALEAEGYRLVRREIGVGECSA